MLMLMLMRVHRHPPADDTTLFFSNKLKMEVTNERTYTTVLQ